MKRKLECISLKYVLSSVRTLDILKIGVGTHNWMYVRKMNFHVSCTWYKSLIKGILKAEAQVHGLSKLLQKDIKHQTPNHIKVILKVEAHLWYFMVDNFYLADVIEQPNFRIPNPQYLQRNFCFDFFNDSENTFWGFFEI